MDTVFVSERLGGREIARCHADENVFRIAIGDSEGVAVIDLNDPVPPLTQGTVEVADKPNNS